jgi:hypothetical protein
LKIRIPGAVCTITLLAASLAYGQQPLFRANVGVKFSVAGKELPAGKYSFSRDSAGGWINIEGPGKVALRVPVVTRLAAGIHTTPKDAHLVFDTVGGNHYLSEVWVPNQDGYLLRTTKNKHEHAVLDVPQQAGQPEM